MGRRSWCDHRAAEYHQAGTAENLRSAYQTRGSRMQVSAPETELTGLLAVVAAIVAWLSVL
jgi:Ca-activated chloride channel homolog